MFEGQVLKIFLDNVPADELGSESDDKYAPADFYAGWYYGLSGHDKRDKIHDCYEPNEKLSAKFNEGIEAALAGKSEKADEFLDKARKLMTKALDGCRQLDYHMFGKWAERVDAIEDRPDA